MNHVMPPSTSNTIGALLRRSTARNPEAIALLFEDRCWTYREFETAVHRVARRLMDTDLPAGSRVAVYGANSDAYAILFFACALTGLVHVPVNFALKGDELSYLLEDSGAVLVIADEQRASLVNQVREQGQVPTVKHLWALLPTAEHNDSILDTAMDPNAPVAIMQNDHVASSDLAQLLCTSGTTSAPKGAMMTHASLMAQYVSAIIALDLTAEDRPLIAMPLYHSAAMHVFLLPYLSLGASVRLLAKPDIPQMLALVESERIGSLFLAPTVWVPLSNHPDLATRDLSSLAKAQYGASIMPVTVLQRLRARYPKIG
ncbi:AMP-binding protein, partial [Glutamicibacter ardleyensis]